MALQGLEIRRSSATLRGGGTGLRKMPTVAKYIDTTICIGCKACEVACQEWNDLPLARTEQTGTYYDPQGVGGTGVITVLKHGDHPEWYGLPKDPTVPTTVSVWKRVLHPIGFIAMAAAVFGAIGHFMAFGPKKPQDTARETEGDQV